MATNRSDDVVDLRLDENLFPIVGDFSLPLTSIFLRRVAPPSGMTDFAEGNVSLSLTLDRIVSARDFSIGELKARYR
jgi:hypothetical protein